MTDPDPAWAEGQAQYDALVRELAETLDLDAGVADALASVRAEGLEPTPAGHAALRAVAAGELTADEAAEALRRHHEKAGEETP